MCAGAGAVFLQRLPARLCRRWKGCGSASSRGFTPGLHGDDRARKGAVVLVRADGALRVAGAARRGRRRGADFSARATGTCAGCASPRAARSFAYAIVAYKTPWCLIAIIWPFYFAFAAGGDRRRALAGSLGHRRGDGRRARVFAARRAGAEFPRRSPTRRSRTSMCRRGSDVNRLLGPLRTLAAQRPTNYHMPGYVVLAEAHPLPWLLGDFTRVNILNLTDLPDDVSDGEFFLVAEEYQEEIERTAARRVVPRDDHAARTLRRRRSGCICAPRRFAALFPGRTPEVQRGRRRNELRRRPALRREHERAARDRARVSARRARSHDRAPRARWRPARGRAGRSGRAAIDALRGAARRARGNGRRSSIFALVSLRAFLWLVFVEGDTIKVLSPNNLGDLALHLTYIRYLAERRRRSGRRIRSSPTAR